MATFETSFVWSVDASGLVHTAQFITATFTDLTGTPVTVQQDGVDVVELRADGDGVIHFTADIDAGLLTVGPYTLKVFSQELLATAQTGVNSAELDAISTGTGTARVLIPSAIPDLSTVYAPVLDADGNGVVRKSELVYNVRDYGAVGDGTTDDLTACQNALDAARLAGGGIVLLPAGYTFRVTGNMVTYSDIHIRAHGATIVSDGGPFVHDYTAADVGTLVGYTNHRNISIEGGVWDMRGHLFPSAGSHVGFNLNHGRGFTIRDLTIRNVRDFHAIDLQGCQHVLVENCRFEGYVQGASTFPREAIQIDHGGETGDAIPDDDIVVRNCYCGPSPVSGELGPWGRFVGSHTVGTGPHTRLKVVNNTIEGTIDSAIKPYSWSNSVISGNVISNTGASAIHCTPKTGVPPRYLLISNNVIDTVAAGSGIEVATEDTGATKYTDVIVTGNQIADAGPAGTDAGVEIWYSHNVQVSNNRITGGNFGVFCRGGDGPSVTGNTITLSGVQGIYVAGGTGALVEGNEIIATGSYGIQVSDGAGFPMTGASVLSNHIRQPGGAGAIRLSVGSQGVFVMGNRVTEADAATCAAVLAYGGGTGAGNESTSGAIVGNHFSGNGYGYTTAGAPGWFRLSGGNTAWEPNRVTLTWGGGAGAYATWSTTTGFNTGGHNYVVVP